MNKFRFTIKLAVIATFLFAIASVAQAQATRTWVSGVGDDVNPCSRTAPCKTFAGAISKTANGGEIDALDPGGFGAVTITKNITIDGTWGGGFGSILASSTNGVTINDSLSGAPNTAVVTLRKLSINGAGGNVSPFMTGLNGVNFISGKSVNIEHCQIFNFTQNGVRVATTAAGISYELHMQDVSIYNSAAGVNASATGGGSFIAAIMDELSIRHANPSSGDGVILGTNAVGVLRNSYISNQDRGVDVAAASLGVSIINCTISACTTGINLAGATSRITHSTITGNPTGVNFAGGTLRSFGDNVYDGNSNNFVGGAISPQTQQ
ncbi:MAG TPA: hypothetical protein VGW76_20430 [Pyrinomonadaceae bacterium]|nr:hypothetical protein [Pyrinomonadaceae bacterium]